MDAWQGFLLAEAGASAVLIGLIFVAVSISLSKILTLPRMPKRALEALLLLMVVLVVSTLLLVPGQSATLMGVEVLGAGVAAWITVIVVDVGVWRSAEPVYRQVTLFNISMNQLSVIPYLVAGFVLLVSGLSGLYWLVPAFTFSFIKAILDSWVLLVEIHR